MVDRRTLLGGALGAGAIAAGIPSLAQASGKRREPFRYSLNTSTIRGQKLSLAEEIDIAAKAGYDAFEPWIGELDAHAKAGNPLADIRKRIEDRGLVVESSIGFFEWIVDDDSRRARALDEAKRCMDLVRQIGGKRLAAPPVGATDQANLELMRAAERYRALLEVGDQIGVVPQAEVWGFSKCLNRLGAAGLVAVESRHPKACVLADVYHLYKGGSDFEGLKLLSGAAMQVFHVNDYPANLTRDVIKDADRVYPGDGVAPLAQVFRDLRALGFSGILSLELFNPDYWKQDAYLVAKTGLEKIKAAVHAALPAT